jgi:tetratricopeptide (TPR) repeat protein
LSKKLDTPNACNSCHKDKDVQWSVSYVKKWYGDDFIAQSHFAELLYTGRHQGRVAESALIQLAADTAQASIVSATALWLLRNYPSQKTVQILREALNHNDALHRYAALYALEILTPNERVSLAKHLLKDPVRTVRIQAARSLSGVSAGALSPLRRKEWQQAIEEYIATQLINADHPSAHLNLGTLYLAMKQYEKAEDAYQTAIKIEPSAIFAYINLADLYRILNREDEGEQILRRALNVNPNSADAYYALGLLMVRQKRTSEALNSLKRAKNIDPDDPNLSYAYALALNSAGKTDSALVVLHNAYTQNPYNQQILLTLVTIYRDLTIYDSAIKYVHELLALAPQNPIYNQLLQQLQVQQAQ